LVNDLTPYEQSFFPTFRKYIETPLKEVSILALLPSYLERNNSSLVYMVNALLPEAHSTSGFFLNDFEALRDQLLKNEEQGLRTLLLGVSFALLDFSEAFPMKLNHTTIMETGGMKGRREELTRTELHTQLCKAFQVNEIHSEYGMTELFSQAYSKGKGLFEMSTLDEGRLQRYPRPLDPTTQWKAWGIEYYRSGQSEFMRLHSHRRYRDCP